MAHYDPDKSWMRAALALARRGLGRTAPNPTVGCVIVKDDIVVGRGWTQPGGRPHAEPQALAQAGENARGATAYVSLEPCAHHGKTPPCAEALIKAGVARVVAALEDPDPRVSGRGLKMLMEAGVNIRSGVLREEALTMNAGFISRITRGRPFVTAKLATTLDARVATGSGESKWITGPEARAHGHLERARHDAILVGAGTYEADKPSLDCRLPAMGDYSSLRFIIKGKRQISAVSSEFEILEDASEGWPEPASILTQLASKGLGRILIEGGPTLITSFMRAGLIDRLLWYRAPMVFGGDGRACLDGLDVAQIVTAPRFKLAERRQLGQDCLEIFERIEKEPS